MKVEFHADDFGLFVGQSKRILRCFQSGALNGVSILTNGEDLEQCLALIQSSAGNLDIAVHLNFLQGKSKSEQQNVDLLTDKDGYFNLRFVKLLFSSYGRKRKLYKQQLKREIIEQINTLKGFCEEHGKRIRIDSHAHWHMIPVVFDALMEGIKEEGLDVEYIRIPDEPVGLLIRNARHLIPFKPINIIKMLVLHLLAKRNLRKYRDSLQNMEKKVFTGVLLSDAFTYEKACFLLPKIKTYAAKRNAGVELLAHPGKVTETDDIKRITNADDMAFFLSPHRDSEAEMFIKMKKA